MQIGQFLLIWPKCWVELTLLVQTGCGSSMSLQTLAVCYITLGSAFGPLPSSKAAEQKLHARRCRILATLHKAMMILITIHYVREIHAFFQTRSPPVLVLICTVNSKSWKPKQFWQGGAYTRNILKQLDCFT